MTLGIEISSFVGVSELSVQVERLNFWGHVSHIFIIKEGEGLEKESKEMSALVLIVH